MVDWGLVAIVISIIILVPFTAAVIYGNILIRQKKFRRATENLYRPDVWSANRWARIDFNEHVIDKEKFDSKEGKRKDPLSVY